MTSQHPGKILLKHYLEPQQISQNKLARAINVPPRRINEIIHGKRSISADTAVRLGLYFDCSASYWLHLQAEYDIEKIRHAITLQLGTLNNSPVRPVASPDAKPSTKKNKTPTSVKRRIMR